MIRRLRIRHRRVFGVLALVLPIGFVAAVMARPDFPVAETSPSALRSEPPGERLPEPGPSIEAPDVLVYLVPGSFSGDALPDDARLLGSQTGGLRLPPGLEGEHTLVYYSLGHGRVVSTRRL